MAQRRMFSKDVVDSDKFLDMPPTTQNLYFHLGIHADDDGFVASPQKIKRAVSASDDDLRTLEIQKFIIPFNSGIIVIADWLLNNQIRKDRYTETIYKSEKKQIILTDEGRYEHAEQPNIEPSSSGNQMATSGKPSDNQMATSGQPSGNQVATQYSIEQDSIGQFSKEKDSQEQDSIEQGSLDYGGAEAMLSAAYVHYESTFGKLGEIDKKSLLSLRERYGELLLGYAITKACRKGDEIQSPLAYITSILKEWKNKGFQTIDDIEEEQEEFNDALDLPF